MNLRLAWKRDALQRKNPKLQSLKDRFRTFQRSLATILWLPYSRKSALAIWPHHLIGNEYWLQHIFLSLELSVACESFYHFFYFRSAKPLHESTQPKVGHSLSFYPVVKTNRVCVCDSLSLCKKGPQQL